MERFDVIVIGAGPGGYVAAIRAAQCGLKAAVVEAEHLGGICLNWGCIPTKALLKSASVYRQIQSAADYGVSVSEITPDINKMMSRSRKVAKKLTGGISHLMKKHSITVLDGWGEIIDPHTVAVKSSDKTMRYQAVNIIIATGASPVSIPGINPDGEVVWNYRDALQASEIPDSLAVIGSGAIGIEFANFFQALGSEVTVIEMMSQILPAEDKEIAGIAMQSMRNGGMQFQLQSRVKSLVVENNRACLMLATQDGELEQVFDKVISAVGVRPNINGLGLSNVGVELDDNGFIKTDAAGRTSVDNIFAIGDVAGAPCLAHKASHEGIIAVDHITQRHSHTMDKQAIPACTYGFPQVASIGLTEEQAIANKLPIRVGRFPAMANGKAIAQSATDGLMKVIFHEQTGELLGAHLVGDDVTEMIQGFAIGKTLETTEEQLMETIFPHPTLSEMMHESVLDAFDRAIHI